MEENEVRKKADMSDDALCKELYFQLFHKVAEICNTQEIIYRQQEKLLKEMTEALRECEERYISASKEKP